MRLCCYFALFLFSNTAIVFAQNKSSILVKGSLEIRTLTSQAYDLTRSLPRGYVRDGSKDYTSFVQDGINKHRIVKLPPFPILINFNGLKVNSENTIIFLKGSQLKMKPNNKVGYSIILVQNVSNVSIINANIVGDRFEHLEQKGQWGMGIRIVDSQNILIQDPAIKHCWGDGIYFGDNLNNSVVNENVLISNANIDNNRRNGITITSGRRIDVINTKITNSNGTMPMAGLDIEPNDNKNIISDIYVKNLYTRNRGAGLIVSLGQLKGSNQNITVEIDNHVNDGGTMGFYAGRLEYANSRLRGEIVNNNAYYTNSRNNGILIEGYSGVNSPMIIFNSPKIVNPNTESQKSERWGSGIVFLRDGRRAPNHKLGNFIVNNAEIIDGRKSPKTRAAFHFIDDKNAGFINTKVTGIIKTTGVESSKKFLIKSKGVSISTK